MHTILNRIDRLMMAVTFAEANEPELARECLNDKKPALTKQNKQTQKRTGRQAIAHPTAS